MRVTFRLSQLRSGGTERVFLSVADYLSTHHGFLIDFVVDDINGQETEQVARDKGYRVVGLGASRSWASIFPFRRYLRETSPDVVFSAYTETNAAALLANGLNGFKTPLVVTEHASLDEHWAAKPWARKLMLEAIVRYLYRLADHAMCVSRGMAEQLARRLSQMEVGYIHNPVRFAERRHSKEEARRQLGLDVDLPLILAVGRIARQKNYLMLLRAFSRILKHGEYRLCIVGGVYEASEKAMLAQFIADNDIGHAIRFVDFTNEVQVFYEAADVLALSSAWEGFGNVLVEALAFGLPVVSTRCNFGPAEILEDGKYGRLVAVDDEESMAAAILEVLAGNLFDPDGQRRRANDFSEQRIGAQYFQLIQKLVS